MTNAYIEAIYFTETGDSDQPSADAEIEPIDKAKAFIDCRNFIYAIGPSGYRSAVDEFESIDFIQLGYDLWLSRNGHGVSFFDRIELYGELNTELFSRIAASMGSHEVQFKELSNEKGARH